MGTDSDNSRLRILHVVPSLDTSRGAGLGASAFELHTQMLREGRDSHLYTAEPGLHRDADPRHLSCPPSYPRNPFFYNPRNGPMLRRLVAQADIVHQHGLYTHLNWCVGEACSRNREFLVYHPHGTLAPWYLRRKRSLKRLVHWLFEDRNFRRTNLWRAVSDDEAQAIRGLIPDAKTVTVPNGIFPERFPDRAKHPDKSSFPELDPNHRWLLFFGRISQVKGIDLLLEAWKGLSKFHADWQLVIAGPDGEGYLRDARRRASALSPSGRPHFMDPLRGEEKVQMLNAADLFVLPSRAEGFSVAALEAMAAGNPVVLSEECNFPEVTSQGVGWLCRTDIASVRDTLATALSESTETLQRRGSHARSFVAERYAWRRVSETLCQATASL